MVMLAGTEFNKQRSTGRHEEVMQRRGPLLPIGPFGKGHVELPYQNRHDHQHFASREMPPRAVGRAVGEWDERSWRVL